MNIETPNYTREQIIAGLETAHKALITYKQPNTAEYVRQAINRLARSAPESAQPSRDECPRCNGYGPSNDCGLCRGRGTIPQPSPPAPQSPAAAALETFERVYRGEAQSPAKDEAGEVVVPQEFRAYDEAQRVLGLPEGQPLISKVADLLNDVYRRAIAWDRQQRAQPTGAADLAARQRHLDPEVASIVYENMESMYESAPQSPAKSESAKLDAAVEAFAAAMKKRLHSKRRQGFRGWDSPGIQDAESRLLKNSAKAAIDHDKQSCIDAANFAMMLWHYEDKP